MAEERAVTALVLEDFDPDFELVKRLLAGFGISATRAASAREGLRLLQSGLRPDVILCDLYMPDGNGWVFGIELDRDPELRTIPLVVMSGVVDPESPSWFLKGAGFLRKPVTRDALFEVLARCCRLTAKA